MKLPVATSVFAALLVAMVLGQTPTPASAPATPPTGAEAPKSTIPPRMVPKPKGPTGPRSPEGGPMAHTSMGPTTGMPMNPGMNPGMQPGMNPGNPTMPIRPPGMPGMPGMTPQPLEEIPIDLNHNVGVIKLTEFVYNPSKRDPFISHKVISPFVTEVVDPGVQLDQDQLKVAKNQIETFIRSKIQIRGISTQANGSGYAIILVNDREMIIRPGSTVTVALGEDEDGFGETLKNITGIKVDMNSTGTGIPLVTQRVDERYTPTDGTAPTEIHPAVIFRSPCKIKGEAETDISIPYKKNWGFTPEEEK